MNIENYFVVTFALKLRHILITKLQKKSFKKVPVDDGDDDRLMAPDWRDTSHYTHSPDTFCVLLHIIFPAAKSFFRL